MDAAKCTSKTRTARRGSRYAMALVALGLAGSMGWAPVAQAKETDDRLTELGPQSGEKRRQEAYRMRHEAALLHKRQAPVDQLNNGDDARYSTLIGSYSKALPHTALGEVNPAAYTALINALRTGDNADFEAIPMGGTVKLADPQASYAYELIGVDSHALALPPAPAFASAQIATELVELYWQALTRDVPFFAYDTDPLTIEAARDLSRFPEFRGPKERGTVTTRTLFRGPTPGDLNGPYISQFLLKDVQIGAMRAQQRYRTTVAGNDHMTDLDSWLRIQNGQPPSTPSTFDLAPRYIRNDRDLTEYVHYDFPYQASLNAALILLDMKAPTDAGNPYRSMRTQSAFATFGAPDMQDLLAKVTNAALKAAWYQKWLVHRRVRPEAFAGSVHVHLTGATRYPFSQDLLLSSALPRLLSAYGTYLLPQAYPEGCPTHPSYPAGHAAVIGAGVTALKAFFDESFVIPNPVQAGADGLSLVPVTGVMLTVGGELNKLAANIALGRDAAGVHWRSDGIEGLKLGEQVAIEILRDYKAACHEPFAGFSLTKFDGTTVTIE